MLEATFVGDLLLSVPYFQRHLLFYHHTVWILLHIRYPLEIRSCLLLFSCLFGVLLLLFFVVFFCLYFLFLFGCFVVVGFSGSGGLESVVATVSAMYANPSPRLYEILQGISNPVNLSIYM